MNRRIIGSHLIDLLKKLNGDQVAPHYYDSTLIRDANNGRIFNELITPMKMYRWKRLFLLYIHTSYGKLDNKNKNEG